LRKRSGEPQCRRTHVVQDEVQCKRTDDQPNIKDVTPTRRSSPKHQCSERYPEAHRGLIVTAAITVENARTQVPTRHDEAEEQRRGAKVLF
jgi:hypothetical protein